MKNKILILGFLISLYCVSCIAQTVSITSPSATATYHQGERIDVTYTVETTTGTFNAGNKFHLILSEPDGTFPEEVSDLHKLGSIPGTGGGTFHEAIPIDQAISTLYRIEIVSTDPVRRSPTVDIHIIASAITTREPNKHFYKPGEAFEVSFATSVDVPGNLNYVAQFSDENGDFTTLTSAIITDLRDNQTVTEQSIRGMVPSTEGDGYRIRVIGGYQMIQMIGSNNVQDITISSTDLFIRDRPADIGEEPFSTDDPVWLSEAIWVRRNEDRDPSFSGAQHSVTFLNDNTTHLEHENPAYGQNASNYVYVQVNNRGATASRQTEVLHLYWAKGSTGLAWEDPWTGASTPVACPSGDGSLSAGQLGGEIGTGFTIPEIQPGGCAIIEFEWSPDVMEQAKYEACFTNDFDKRHFCLLARIVTSSIAPFGMSFPETNIANPNTTTAPWLIDNVRKNNNIAWRNIIVDDEGMGAPVPTPGPGPIPGPNPGRPDTSMGESALIANFTDQPMQTKLAFTILDEKGNETTFDKGSLRVTLTGKLLDNLERDSVQCSKGNTNEGNGVFIIHQPGIGLDHIVLDPKSMAAIKLQFIPGNPKEKHTGFAITVSQIAVVGGTDKVIGGQTFVCGKVAGFNTEIIGGSHPFPLWLWAILIIVIIVIVIIIVIRRRK